MLSCDASMTAQTWSKVWRRRLSHVLLSLTPSFLSFFWSPGSTSVFFPFLPPYLASSFLFSWQKYTPLKPAKCLGGASSPIQVPRKASALQPKLNLMHFKCTKKNAKLWWVGLKFGKEKEHISPRHSKNWWGHVPTVHWSLCHAHALSFYTHSQSSVSCSCFSRYLYFTIILKKIWNVLSKLWL